MATTVLQPHDCLRPSPSPSPSAFGPSRNANRNPLRVRRRKQSFADGSSHSNSNNNNKSLMMGQVRILKRGEELSSMPSMKIGDRRLFATIDEDLVLSSTDRLGPDPETVQKHVKVWDGLYAGPASLLASPPPSSLPFPAFFAKERRNDAATATSDLRRLLRLDLA